ncbi:MAG: hypothetical protein IT451_09345 [Candidatus Brocadia sp.]|nr:hypothetical protein [Candidatus Brocadia sp.]
MDFYIIETAGDLNDTSLCLVEYPPEEMGLNDYRLALGEIAAPYFPENAKVYLTDESPGIKLSGILGNTKGYLIGTSRVKDVIKKLCSDNKIEFLPFMLYNHKKRIHSTDYFFINPIGGFDCLKEDACGITYDNEGKVVTVKQYVLDKKKLINAPDLFRIDKIPGEYVISKRLAQALKDNGVTNLLGKKLRVQD